MKQTAKPKAKRIIKKVAPAVPVFVRKGNKLFTKMVERTGIPDGYSASVAWFAERAILAGTLLIALSFSSGVLYTLYLSEPLSETHLYDVVSSKSRLAQEGIRVYSQQVIDVASPLFALLIKDNRDDVDLAAADLAARKEKLKAYLAGKKSPFAEDEGALEAFVNSKNMKLMLAISFVESTLGKHCYYFNCSGIGGTPPNLRKYGSYAEWIADFDLLLENRYKGLEPEEFMGLYVQPGSPNWLYGVKQVLAELENFGG